MKNAAVILMGLFASMGCTAGHPVESKEGAALAVEQCSGVDALIDALDEQGERGAEAAFRSLSCLDGGELEDMYRALGIHFVKRPRDVLAAMKNTSTPASNAAALLVMLPLSYVDDPCAGKKELQHRRQIVLESVHDKATKEVFLTALDGAIVRKARNCPVN